MMFWRAMMFERIRKYIYTRRARRCEQMGHERMMVERAGRVDGLCVIEQRVQCDRCALPLSDWCVVLSETSIERLWKRA
jgi:hypothetical protein